MSNQSFVIPRYSKQFYYVESWYPLIEDLTFKTWIFHLTQEEGELLNRITLQTIRRKPIAKKDQESLKKCISKISDFFEKVKKESPPNSGYFLRLGSRSLKDAVFHTKKAFKRFRDYLYQRYLDEYKSLNLETKEEKISWVNKKTEMNDLYYISECDIQALKCYKISQMFELFFNSERIFVDLNREAKFESPKYSLNFRLWDDRITYDMEFRGFDYHHKFCALTQYDNRMHHSQVHQNKEKILQAITDFYETKVRPRMEPNCPIPEGAYVIDFAVIFNGTDVEEVIVIEINNFTRTTGSSLFHWDMDIDVLTGKKDFEFRLIEENRYANVDYSNVIDSEIIMTKNNIKAKIINENKSFSEKYFKWRKKVVPMNV